MGQHPFREGFESEVNSRFNPAARLKHSHSSSATQLPDGFIAARLAAYPDLLIAA
jgi:hypothetical protein